MWREISKAAMVTSWILLAATAGAQDGSGSDKALPPGGDGSDAARAGEPVPVRVVVTSGTNHSPAADVEVELALYPARGERPLATTTGRTGGDGTVTLLVPAGGGDAVEASVDWAGVTYTSERGPWPGTNELEVVIYDITHQRDHLALARVETEINLWEGSVHVTQKFTLTNDGDRTVDVRRTPDGKPSVLAFPLPDGAKAVHTSGPDMRTMDRAVGFRGVVRAGSGVMLRVSYQLDYSDGTMDLRQTFPIPAREVWVVVPKQPVVLGRVVEGVTLWIREHDLQGFDERVGKDGRSFWVGRAAGRVEHQRVVVSGLPERDMTLRYLVGVVALLLLLWGGYTGLVARGGRGPTMDRVAAMERLVALERRVRAGEPGLVRERDALVDQIAALDMANRADRGPQG